MVAIIIIISTDDHVFSYSLGQMARHATSSYHEQDSTVVGGPHDHHKEDCWEHCSGLLKAGYNYYYQARNIVMRI